MNNIDSFRSRFFELSAFVILFILLTHPGFPQKLTGEPVTGNRHSIHSSALGEERSFSISLPSSYGETSQSYPLLLILDGNDFFPFMAATVRYYGNVGIIPEMIVAGVDSRDRWHDFTPTRADIPDGTPLPTSGGAESFSRFIREELMPDVESNYRAAPFRVLYGHSVGGLFVINSLLSQPDDFSGYIATSPSMWWDNELMTKEILQKRENNPAAEKYLFITMGNEGGTMLDPVLNFTAALKKAQPANVNWEFRQFEKADHLTMPFKAFPYALEFIFSDWQLPAETLQKGLHAVAAHYKNLSEKYGYHVQVPEAVLNGIGYREMNKGNMEAALEAFRMNAENYPESANVYDSIGEFYLKNGNREKAIDNYRRSLELNPQNANALKVLKQLESGAR
ncbi:MAG: alpha/beta hydrolase-fold protein [Calditrichia bacterium]